MEPRHRQPRPAAPALSATVGIVLAAGAGTRFGGAVKQLAPFRGRPLISHPIETLREAGLDRILVVLGARAEQIAPHVHGAEVLVCEDWAEGQSASLKLGVIAAYEGGGERVVIVLGDQPLLHPEAVRRVVAAAGPGVEIARAAYEDGPGHPVMLAAATFGAVAALTGDQGARQLIERFRAVKVPCAGLGSAADADTPEELGRLQALS